MMNQNDAKSQYSAGDEVRTVGGAHVRLVEHIEGTRIWRCKHVAGKSPFAGSMVSEDNIAAVIKRADGTQSSSR